LNSITYTKLPNSTKKRKISNFPTFEKQKVSTSTMKFLATLLPISAFADFANMEQQFQAKANVSQSSQFSRSATNFGTGFTSTILSSFHEYGCWCYFDGRPVAGKSSPVNAIDSHCKALADGYACAAMDESTTCNAWEESYTVNSGLTGQALMDDCMAQNVGTCAQIACKVESHFIDEMTAIAFDQSIDSEIPVYGHANGFVPATSCTINRKPASDKLCCGDYPLRFPFRTSSEGDGVVNRACCVNKTYDSDNMICCTDGSINIVCDE